MRVLSSVVVLLGLIPGCAREATSQGLGLIGPHGGALIALPGEVGYAEITLESGRSYNDQVQVVAYFLAPSLEAALHPLPTEVTIQIAFPDRAPASVSLSHRPKTDDRVGDGRFTSRPGPYAVEPLQGMLSGMIKGQPFTSRFKSSR